MLNSVIIEDNEGVKRGLKQPFYVIRDALEAKYAERLHDLLLQFKKWAVESENTSQGEGVPELDKDYSHSRKSILLNSQEAPAILHQLDAYLNVRGF